MANNTFFNETTSQSLVKATIVDKYFKAWAGVMIGVAKKNAAKYKNKNTEPKIAYIDLFAGPGRYKDGTKSTPLKVIKTAIENEDMRQMLVAIFNDKDEDNSKCLEKEIKNIQNINTLRYTPQVYNQEVGDNIVDIFEANNLIPTLFFVDPWGYKGLSLKLVNSVLKDWGCDCIFFFNYNRVNMGLSNPAVEMHMNALFGKKKADKLREYLPSLSPKERELTIVEELCQSLRLIGGKYVLPFCFRNDNGNRTSHHLIFVSKGFKGYEIMKEIMAGESSTAAQGVASFEYSSANIRQPMLFELTRPLDELAGMLLTKFAGREMTMRQIYEEHNVGTPYIAKNYKQVLKELEANGAIIATPPADKRKKNSFADTVTVTFPS